MSLRQSNYLSRCYQNVPLSKYSSFGIGGPARYFNILKTPSDIQELFTSGIPEKMPILFLGNGSNCLFDDKGFDGLVLLNKISSLKREDNHFVVGTGISLAKLSRLTASLSYTGLEFGTGIPGTIGGGIFMNAGAHGYTISNALSEVLFMPYKGPILSLKKEDPQFIFNYRFSSFQQMNGIILEAIFDLKIDKEAAQRELYFRQTRLKSQPYQEKSAGCVFRNPPNQSAGKLIDECGLKNFTYGDAVVSHKHANFIVNTKNASANDILCLIQIIKEIVFEKTSIHLQEEILIIPYERTVSLV